MGEKHRFRATWHDYNTGTFFITICSYKRRCIFGTICNQSIFHPTTIGTIINEEIKKLESYHTDIEIINYVVMPNHLHFIIQITDLNRESSNRQTINKGCLKPPMHGESVEDFHHNTRLATIIGAFKAGVTRRVRKLRITDSPVWQTLYHEHIIRSETALLRISNYIDNNIGNWLTDCYQLP